MIAPPEKAKYKRLRVAVQSYTQGFTSVMWPAFGELASQARKSKITHFEIDFLQRKVVSACNVPISDEFFDYRDLADWFDAVGCSIEKVIRFQMVAEFDPSTTEDFQWDGSSESLMAFRAHTEIESDHGQIYTYDYDSKVWFDFKYE